MNHTPAAWLWRKPTAPFYTSLSYPGHWRSKYFIEGGYKLLPLYSGEQLSELLEAVDSLLSSERRFDGTPPPTIGGWHSAQDKHCDAIRLLIEARDKFKAVGNDT